MATTLSKRPEGVVRSFVAIELPPAIRTTLAAVTAELAEYHSVLKIVPPDLMHLTVKFLGDVPLGRVAHADQALRAATLNCRSFRLTLESVGTFPDSRTRPRVIWASIQRDDGYAACLGLYATVEELFAAAGFAQERRAPSPHLTLARVRDTAPPDIRAALARAFSDLRSRLRLHGTFEVSSLVLLRSDLSPRGPAYTPLAHARFGV